MRLTKLQLAILLILPFLMIISQLFQRVSPITQTIVAHTSGSVGMNGYRGLNTVFFTFRAPSVSTERSILQSVLEASNESTMEQLNWWLVRFESENTSPQQRRQLHLSLFI
jgi:hypothetical protein